MTTSTRRQKLRALAEAHDAWVQRHLTDVEAVFEPRDGDSDYNLHNVDVDADGQAEDELAAVSAEIFDGAETVTNVTTHSSHNEYNSDVITAGKWVEKAHPRDEDGKFTDKGLGAVKAVLGKSLHINTAVIYKHKYADGAVVAEKSATGQSAKQRLTWDAEKKKFILQHDLAGDWKTVNEYGKGAAYQKFSKETGWLTPASSEESSTAAPSLKSLAAKYVAPTIKIDSQSSDEIVIAIIKRAKTAKSGDVLAVRQPETHRIIKSSEKFGDYTLQSYDKNQGTWESIQHFSGVFDSSLANFIYKNQNWKWDTQPKTKTPVVTVTPSTSSITTKPDLASALTIPLHVNTTVIYKTKYGHGAVVAYRQSPPDQLDRLVWSENLKKFTVQRKLGDGDWHNVYLYGKGEAYKTFSKETGWYAPEKGDTATGTPGFTGFVSAPSKLTTPAVTSTTGASTSSTPVKTVTPKVPTTQKFDAAQLQALHGTPPTLDVDEINVLYHNFKYLGGGAAITLNSQSSKIFKALHKTVEKHNKGLSAEKLNLLQAVRLIDERSTYGGENKHLYEQKLVAWLQTPSGKTTATNTLLGEAALKKTPALKKTLAPKKPGAGAKHWSEIGTPRTDVTSFANISHANALKMQAEIIKSEPWTDAQRKSLKAYTGKGYLKINQSLRYGSGTDSHAKHIQDAMRPLSRSIKVYRSTVKKQFPGLDNSSSFAELKAFEGKTVTDKGFMSTSIASRVGLVSLEIDVPVGTPAAYVASLSYYPSERELLLAAGLNYRVTSVTQTIDGVVVKLRVVP